MCAISRQTYRIRRATPKYGTEITLPPEIRHQQGLRRGDMVDVLYDGFVLIVPQGTVVNEAVLTKTLRLPGDRMQEAETVARREG